MSHSLDRLSLTEEGNMIIRVRTNLGASRLDIDPTCTLAQLIDLIIKTLNIQRPTVTLSSDLAGANTYEQSDLTLSDLGIKQGMEVFVVGKFEKRVVEKSYINEQGEVVPAGQTLVQVDVDGVNQNDPAALKLSEGPQSGEKSASVDIDKKECETETKTEAAQQQKTAVVNTNNEGSTDNPEPADIPFNYEAYSQAYDYEDANDGVRAPDEARKMTLLGGDGDASIYSNGGSDGYGHYDIGNTAAGRSLMHAVLSPEDQAQIDELEKSLKDLGLWEYEVLQETQNLQDELIARRLQRESARDARTMAAADLLRTPDLLTSMQDLDATLARYHAAQQPQPAVLRLQQYQQGHKTAAKNNSNSNGTSNSKADGGGGNAALRSTGQKAPVQSKDRDSGPAIATDRSTSQHSDITQSSASSVNNTHAKSTASSIKSSVKGRQPSKAYTDAMKQLEDVAHDIGELASTSHTRLSALQQGALRTLTAPLPAPAPTSAVLNTTHTSRTPARASTRTPARSMKVDTTASTTERTAMGVSGSGTSLLHALSPTSTLSRSDTSPARPNMTHNPHSDNRPIFDPVAAYTAGLGDYEVDEDALLMLLSQEMQPPASKKGAAHSPAVLSSAADARNSKPREEGLRQPAPTTSRPSQATPVTAEPRQALAQEQSTPAPDTAPSLADSGYKSMAQIKAEKANQVNMRIGHTGRAASMPNVTAPVSNTNNSSRAAAPYSMQAHRGVLQSDDSADRRTGGVATTVVTQNQRHSAHTGDAGMYDDEGMNDTLALALQLSLEDSQQQQAQLRHHQDHTTHSAHTSQGTSQYQQKPAKGPPARTRVTKKPAATDSKNTDILVPPSTLLPSSRRPIAVLLPNTGARGGAARAAVERANAESTDRETAAARRLAQERIQQERRLQEQLDAETAAEIVRQEEADELAAREYQRALDRETETSLLRGHLHGHNTMGPAASLPGWLDRTVNDFANDALLNLAENRSFNAQPYAPAGTQNHHHLPVQRQPPAPAVAAQQRAAARPQRPYVEPERAAVYDTYNYGDANYMNVEYDQDDEVLAQAIQNSLNDAYY